MKEKNEYEKFENLAQAVLKVPHAEIKRKLDAEKRAKNRKKAKRNDKSNKTLL